MGTLTDLRYTDQVIGAHRDLITMILTLDDAQLFDHDDMPASRAQGEAMFLLIAQMARQQFEDCYVAKEAVA